MDNAKLTPSEIACLAAILDQGDPETIRQKTNKHLRKFAIVRIGVPLAVVIATNIVIRKLEQRPTTEPNE